MTSCFALHHSCQRKNVFLASATAWAISMCYSSIGPLPVRHWKSENGCLWQNYIPTCLVWIPPWRWHAQCGTGPFQVNVFCAGWAWLVFHHWRWQSGECRIFGHIYFQSTRKCSPNELGDEMGLGQEDIAWRTCSEFKICNLRSSTITGISDRSNFGKNSSTFAEMVFGSGCTESPFLAWWPKESYNRRGVVGQMA